MADVVLDAQINFRKISLLIQEIKRKTGVGINKYNDKNIGFIVAS